MKTLIYTFIISLFFGGLYAQNLEGIVVDEAKQALFDVYIYTPDGERHTHSDELGKFSLPDMSEGDTIMLRYLGYHTLVHQIEKADLDGEIRFQLEEAFFDLQQVYVSNSLESISKVSAIDLRTNPVRSSQEILRRVPGLFIAQHAGGGKAEQIFLRGFDIDHGTDISISVDGLPVNMVSHAHGQGYADLHFVIPETIDRIQFGKGPYQANQGNFSTAGYVNFKTKDRLEQSSIGLEYGRFNTTRAYGLFDLLGSSDHQDAYIAAEYQVTDGPVESPQNFNRINLMGKYTVQLPNEDQLSILLSHFQSKWDASGQIPQRLVDNGTISRFGSVDDTEGGQTSRTNVAMYHTKSLGKRSFVKTQAFYSQYDFELYSNFTFFLEDPVNGDQIRQREQRNIFGISSTIFQDLSLRGVSDLELSYGLGLRYDDINDNELSRTLNRRTRLEALAMGQVDETNLYGFVNAKFDFGKWLINPSLRLDAFQFDYVDDISIAYESLSERKNIVSPKLNIIYNPSLKWQLFLKAGRGFHSNDTRVVVAQEGRQILPAAYGMDFGTVWKPLPRLWVNGALWFLYLEQEFVYVGDAGIVEPSGKTERKGIELGFRYQLTDHLFWDTDVNYTYARATEEAENENYIPLAPDLTAMGGLSLQLPNGLAGGIRARYLKDRPANEDNSLVAKGYFITDLNVNYRFKNKLSIGVAIENLFNAEWNEAQFATESRLQNEAASVEEIHFTPGVPFFLKGSVRYGF